MVDDTRQRFEEEIRRFISERMYGGESTTDIGRFQVEEIGERLGMTPSEACAAFLTLRGSVWQGRPFHTSDLSDPPPPRNWTGMNGIYLL